MSNHSATKSRRKAHSAVAASAERAVPAPKLLKRDYKRTLRHLQIELVKLQRHIIQNEDRILVILEGRDGAGKDGTIKRIIEHLSPREVRVVALGKPSDHENRSWYFERYVAHLPAAQEMVLFNRSWYNRAGVEPVMGFCTEAESREFLETAPLFEQLLARSGIRILKYYLDISREEQKKRLKARRDDPLSQWKISPIDRQAQRHWEDYSRARDEMLSRTHHASAPWTVVKADSKPVARLELIRHLLSRVEYAGKQKNLLNTNPEVIFDFEPACLTSGRIEP